MATSWFETGALSLPYDEVGEERGESPFSRRLVIVSGSRSFDLAPYLA
jgi:hypothetical protein